MPFTHHALDGFDRFTSHEWVTTAQRRPVFRRVDEGGSLILSQFLDPPIRETLGDSQWGGERWLYFCRTGGLR